MEYMSKVRLMFTLKDILLLQWGEALNLDANLFSVLQMLSWNHFSRAKASKPLKDSFEELVTALFCGCIFLFSKLE